MEALTEPTTTAARVAPVAQITSPKLRRRPLLIVLAVVLVAAGALLGVWLWMSASAGTDVVVVRAAVDRGRLITVADLGTARVAVDPAVRTVPAARLLSLVGKRAASDLASGSLLTPDQVTDAVAPGTGQSVVGIPVAAGLMPNEALRPGDEVRLVQTPGQAGEVAGDPVTIAATVLSVVPGDTQTVVDVVVSSNRAAELAARAATGKVAVVLDSRAK